LIIPSLTWCARLAGLSPQPAQKTARWLSHPDKLSPLLKRSHQALRVDLLQQAVAQPYPEEAHYLNISPQQSTLIREIFLQGDTERWCFARTIVPAATYQSYQQAFDNLGTQLLGETIIYAGQYERGPFEFAYITPDSWLQQRLTFYNVTAIPLWARRSLFWLSEGRYPLSLIEVFLPGIPVR
jgi:chorismate lyase